MANPINLDDGSYPAFLTGDTGPDALGDLRRRADAAAAASAAAVPAFLASAIPIPQRPAPPAPAPPARPDPWMLDAVTRLPPAGVAEIAGAANPIGAAMAVADQAGKQLAGVFNALGDTAKVLGQGFSQLAANDNLGAVKTMADGAATALGKIPIVGQVAEAAIKAFGTGIKAASDVVDAFVERGKELSQFSAPLAIAGAQADIRSLFADIREAEALGPSLARLTDAQSRLSTDLRDMLLPIKQTLIENLGELLDYFRALIAILKAAGEAVGPAVAVATDPLRKLLAIIGPAVAPIQQHLKDIADAAKKDEEDDEPLKAIHDALDRMGGGRVGGSWGPKVDPILGGTANPRPFVPGRTF